MYSYKPGEDIATAMLREPVSVTLPLVIEIFLFVSLSIVVPTATTKGVNLLFLFSKELLSNLISILILPLLPMMSLASVSLPL